MEEMNDDERRALRGSKFAPLPLPPPLPKSSRVAHPGGPITTNKAAALAKFLERKLQEPDGLKSLNPDLVELAIKNAKETVIASKGSSSSSGTAVRHVASFGDSIEDSSSSGDKEDKKRKKRKKKMKKMKRNPKSDKKSKHKKSKS